MGDGWNPQWLTSTLIHPEKLCPFWEDVSTSLVLIFASRPDYFLCRNDVPSDTVVSVELVRFHLWKDCKHSPSYRTFQSIPNRGLGMTFQQTSRKFKVTSGRSCLTSCLQWWISHSTSFLSLKILVIFKSEECYLKNIILGIVKSF